MRRVLPVRRVPLVGILGIALAGAACGGQDASQSSLPSATAEPTDSPSPEPAVQATFEPADAAPAGAVTIAVKSDGIRFHPDEVTVSADSAVFFLVYEGESGPGVTLHNLHIGPELPPGAALVSSPLLNPGESFVFTVTGLEPGEYRFWCTYSDGPNGSHWARGMVGTLTVTP
jgi:plastocyanin